MTTVRTYLLEIRAFGPGEFFSEAGCEYRKLIRVDIECKAHPPYDHESGWSCESAVKVCYDDNDADKKPVHLPTELTQPLLHAAAASVLEEAKEFAEVSKEFS